ncbi:transposase [Desulfonema magnum]|uniref:Transposase DDE domain-containing protein n=1 Tax=Desulfonema magnum TaxID=45655 RepID=A0A975BJ48_9BACT|nr:Transposase DDE domain-containing protein [Desulfonema magnum]
MFAENAVADSSAEVFCESVTKKREDTTFPMTDRQRDILEQMTRRTTCEKRLWERSNIILLHADGMPKRRIAKDMGTDIKTVRKWCERWEDSHPGLRSAEESEEEKMSPAAYEKKIAGVLGDAPRPGAPPRFSPEQVVHIAAIACEVIDNSDGPVSGRTYKDIAREAVSREIVETISPDSVGRFLREAQVKPHKSRYWLNAKYDDEEQFGEEVMAVCDIYLQASELHKQGTHVVCNDEKTGIQALERCHVTHPAEPGGKPQRVEYNYERHGTLCLIANLEVATGRIIAPTISPTGTEDDYVRHITQTTDTDPEAKWIFITDNLNTHQSESLTELIARRCHPDIFLGMKGKSGILKSMETRREFLSDPSHRIHFIYTPKHASWLNQVEIWFSVLSRRLIRRGNFSSTEHLRIRMRKFIDFFNETMAKPFKWTYTGRPLAA